MNATKWKRVGGSRFVLAQLAVVAGLAGLFSPSVLAKTHAVQNGLARKAKPDPSDDFFTNAPITSLAITINATNMATLRADKHHYVRASIREGDQVWGEVGIHCKGSAGSVRELDDRPALTVNFDKYVDRQKFHGLDKISLNNSVQDPSYTTELICGEMFRAAGVPAARTTHARVSLNGRDLGLYVLKEGFDKTFLRRYWKNPKGNLYDAGFLREITDGAEKLSGRLVADAGSRGCRDGRWPRSRARIDCRVGQPVDRRRRADHRRPELRSGAPPPADRHAKSPRAG